MKFNFKEILAEMSTSQKILTVLILPNSVSLLIIASISMRGAIYIYIWLLIKSKLPFQIRMKYRFQ